MSTRDGSSYERQSMAEDEISLVDLWLVLMRRKGVVLGITVLCLALGVGYAMQKPVVYDYRTGIELAEVHGGPESKGLEVLTPKAGAVVLLRDVIIPEQRGRVSGEEDSGPRVQVVENGGEARLMLKSTAEPKNRKKVEKLHSAVGDALAERHAPVFEKRVEVVSRPFAKRAEMLKKQMQFLENQLKQLSKRSYTQNGIQSLVDAQQMGDMREALAESRVKHSDAESAIEVIREASHPTRIEFLAAESEDPAGTGKSLIAALSLVLGLMLGVFGAFFIEFLRTARKAAAEQESG